MAYRGSRLACALAIGAAGCAAPPPDPGSGPPVPAWIRKADPATPVGPRELAIRWYGTAAFAIRSARATLWFDPYFTRDSLGRLLLGPARPRPETWPADLAAPDAVFVGHAHFDHLLDAPEFARRSRARLYASQDALRVARAEGSPERLLVALRPGQEVVHDDVSVLALESRHSDVVTQWLDGGDMPASIRTPMWFLSYRNGPVFTFLIRWRGRTIVHLDSAQLLDAALSGRKADVALACLAGWKSTPGYFSRLQSAIAPAVLVPMHHDDFFSPYSAGVRENVLAALGDAYAAIRRDMPAAAILPLGFFEETRIRAMEEH